MTGRENADFDREILAATEPLAGPDGMSVVVVPGTRVSRIGLTFRRELAASKSVRPPRALST
jgi:hypothetical protein